MKNWKTLLLGVAMVANTSFAAPQVVDKVAAVVNNGVVLESDVDGLMKSVKLNSGEAGQQLPDDATLRGMDWRVQGLEPLPLTPDGL